VCTRRVKRNRLELREQCNKAKAELEKQAGQREQ